MIVKLGVGLFVESGLISLRMGRVVSGNFDYLRFRTDRNFWNIFSVLRDAIIT